MITFNINTISYTSANFSTISGWGSSKFKFYSNLLAEKMVVWMGNVRIPHFFVYQRKRIYTRKRIYSVRQKKRPTHQLSIFFLSFFTLSF